MDSKLRLRDLHSFEVMYALNKTNNPSFTEKECEIKNFHFFSGLKFLILKTEKQDFSLLRNVISEQFSQ